MKRHTKLAGAIVRYFARFLLLGSFLLSGCAVNEYDVKGINLISVAEERQLGDRFAVEIEKKSVVLPDPELQAYIGRVGRRLLTGVRSVDFPYTFKVVKDDSVNAFAIPGGHTYVHTGLIKLADSEDELAAVMAHEINHVVARHGTRQMTQQYGYALVLQLVLGDNPNQLAQLAASLFGKAGTMSYSRGMETQADVLAVETLYKAGYSTQAMVTFFRKMDTQGSASPSQVARFFSSHPLTADRIQRVSDEIAKFPSKPTSSTDMTTFRQMKKKLVSVK